jgi:hypothetical protein
MKNLSGQRNIWQQDGRFRGLRTRFIQRIRLETDGVWGERDYMLCASCHML